MIHAMLATALAAHVLTQSHAPILSPRAATTAAQAPSGAAVTSSLNFDVYRSQVEPLFLVKREGNARCVDCHAPGAGNLRLQVLAPGTYSWTEEQSRKNFEAVSKFVVPGTPRASRLLRHPTSRDAGGDAFHGGGKHWKTQDDPEWQTIAAWVNGTPRKVPTKTAVRIIQTNAAGDTTDEIGRAHV